jgi:hypothetical protein
MNFMMSLGVGFTLTLTAMRVFGPGMVVFWREAAPGVGMGLPKSVKMYMYIYILKVEKKN